MSGKDDHERRLLITRHGERMDAVFGKGVDGWVSKVFDDNGNYTPTDANMPMTMPKRKDQKKEWSKDTNLTEIGHSQAKLVGRALGYANVKLDYIVSSPSLRCIRTAEGIVKGMACLPKATPYKRGIAVEPGLYEFGYFSKSERELPKFFAAEEIEQKYGITLDKKYTPFIQPSQLNIDETLADFHNRSFGTVKHILNTFRDQGCTILISTHAPNFEPLTRQLCGKEMRSWDEYKMPMRQTPYLAMVSVHEKKRGWEVGPAPILPLTHGAMDPFDLNAFKNA